MIHRRTIKMQLMN